jgi:glutaredoxin
MSDELEREGIKDETHDLEDDEQDEEDEKVKREEVQGES